MKILIIDQGAFALDFAMRCLDDKHLVKWYVPDNPKTCLIGKGLVERVADWRTWARWADFIFMPDNVKYLSQLEPYRREGTPILGPTIASAALELDRAEAMKVFADHDIDIPPYKEFSNYDDAIAYVLKTGKPYASKPLGDEPDKNMSYVAKTPADMVYMLQRWKKAGKRMRFILQDLVSGVEAAVGAWVGPHGFSDGWCENFEFKRMMAGECGPQTGEMGTVLRVVRNSKLANKVLAPLEDYLVSLGHVGYVDVNCIIDDAGTPWPLEFTMRPGWPTFNIQQALIDGDHAEWLAALADGQDSKPFKMDTVAAGCLIAIPDFPYSHITRKEVCGVPIYGLTDKLMENIHPCECMLGSAPQDMDGQIKAGPCLVTAGDYVLVVSATGETVRATTRKMYETVKKVKIPNSPLWRSDIGNRLSKQLPLLHGNGYASGLDY
jgi:phosphoribosylamine--glycine ligase